MHTKDSMHRYDSANQIQHHMDEEAYPYVAGLASADDHGKGEKEDAR